MKILFALLPLAACVHRDFATSADHYNSYPGSFERARYLATQAHDAELVAAVNAVGSSHDHNAFTAKLATCMDARLDAARWQRQSEHGDGVDVQAEAGAADHYVRELALRDKGHLPQPEQTWLASARFCVEQCGDVAASDAALGRDRQYAATYLAACKTSVAAAEPAQHVANDRAVLAAAAHALELARDAEARRCFVAEAWALAEADRTGDRSVRDQVAAARAAHPGELARADQFNRDPQVVELQRRQDRLEARLGLAQREATSSEQSIRENDELQTDLREVATELASRARAAGVECPK